MHFQLYLKLFDSTLFALIKALQTATRAKAVSEEANSLGSIFLTVFLEIKHSLINMIDIPITV